MENDKKITIECSGCKRTQTLRKSKLIKCDIYTCSLGECKINADFKIIPKEGFIIVLECNVAGGFCGVNYKKPTNMDLESINRARNIEYLGKMQLKEKGQNPKCN